ncbi:MAG: NYN domain-containing protein [Chloroflexi bacterium]|nr:NYN domain-containing protein [Chloroflexota bacterium]
MRQCTAWEKAGAKVFARSLRYPTSWPQEKAQEKGIDVLLAIDFIRLGMEDTYDVAILASTDTDLVPALEFILNRPLSKKVEVAAWWSQKATNYLRVKGHSVWCHRLDLRAFNTVSDKRDYTLP